MKAISGEELKNIARLLFKCNELNMYVFYQCCLLKSNPRINKKGEEVTKDDE